MSEFDWMDSAAPVPVDEFGWMDEGDVPAADEEEPVDEYALVPRGMSPISIPQGLNERNTMLKEAWESLTRNQQIVLHSLPKHQYNLSATLRGLLLTGFRINRVTVTKWARTNEKYAFVLKVMKAIARDEVIDQDRLLLRANEIAERALTPKPILYQGQPTGFYDVGLDTALRANEQLMKTQKMLGGENEGPQQAGPALVIQVIQPQGQVIDVTPGVKVALPEPEVPDGA